MPAKEPWWEKLLARLPVPVPEPIRSPKQSSKQAQSWSKPLSFSLPFSNSGSQERVLESRESRGRKNHQRKQCLQRGVYVGFEKRKKTGSIYRGRQSRFRKQL
ncbi:hypothetical protein L1049_026078 [Liquidambar formosana]|uniref:Uncharacterized protein n=1 Tax=Liquidambar formosana TaxID=63359 RepID=A0AAP0NCN6_LIQFO